MRNRLGNALLTGFSCATITILACTQHPRERSSDIIEYESSQVMELEKHIWNFGTIRRGETVETTMRLHNRSDSTISISLYSTCDCLFASAESETVPANGSVEIRLRYMGDEVKEQVTKTVFIQAKDHNLVQIPLTVTGRALPGNAPHLVAIPNPLPVPTEESENKTYLELSNRGAQDLAIYEIRCFGCTADLRTALLLGNQSLMLGISLLREWQGNRWVEIESNDPVTPLRKISILTIR